MNNKKIKISILVLLLSSFILMLSTSPQMTYASSGTGINFTGTLSVNGNITVTYKITTDYQTYTMQTTNSSWNSVKMNVTLTATNVLADFTGNVTRIDVWFRPINFANTTKVIESTATTVNWEANNNKTIVLLNYTDYVHHTYADQWLLPNINITDTKGDVLWAEASTAPSYIWMSYAKPSDTGNPFTTIITDLQDNIVVIGSVLVIFLCLSGAVAVAYTQKKKK